MENINKLKDSIRYSNTLIKKSNENNVLIYRHLKEIFTTGTWQNDDFYEGYSELKEYKEKKFSALLSDVYGRSMTWFRNMTTILDELPNGETLYVRHGHANMIAYLGFSPDHREFVLEVAKKKPLSNFHYILNSRGLKGLKKDVKNTGNAVLEKKYLSAKNNLKYLREKYNALKTKHKEVEAENVKLKNQIKKLFTSL